MARTELSVTQLINSADNDSFGLPFFQRDYVWDKKDVTTFLDSMSRNWPAGSIILWDKPNGRGRRFGSLKGNPKEISTDMLVLDGQQRITTLLLIRKDGRIELTSQYDKKIPYYLFFDLEECTFLASRQEKLDPQKYIDVEDILKGKVDIKSIAREYRQTKKKKLLLQRLKKLNEYKFPVVHTRVKSDEEAIDIFNRVNASGEKVDKLELAFARLRDREHEAARRITALQAEWIRKGFDLTPRVLMNSFLIVQNIDDPDYYVRTRNADSQIKSYLENSPAILTDLENVFKRIKDALHFLDRVGFDSDQFLPSENVIAALAGYFERNDIRFHKMTTRRINSLRRWMLRTILFGRYAKTPNFEKDLRVLQDSGRLPEPSARGTHSQDGLIALMYIIGRSNGMTDYRGDKVNWADTMAKGRVIHLDHIYPHSRLTKEEISSELGDDAEALADDIGNKAFAIGESNTSKNKKFPGGGVSSKVNGQWIDELSLLGEAEYQKMLKSEIWRRRYCRQIRSFIKKRRERILRDLKRQIK